ncbi:MAG TPA: hypothetical protein VEB19_08295 [Gemmatimonadaceae bacterium]|nr:hypothetical protein [Gemmatimonadaceae bacterium]
MAKRRAHHLATDVAAAFYPVPRVGDTYLVEPATGERKHVARFIREGTGANARTFTVVNEDKQLAWIRYADPTTGFVDAIHHVDCGGWYGGRCLYARVGELHQTSADALMLAPEDFAAFVQAYPEEAA